MIPSHEQFVRDKRRYQIEKTWLQLSKRTEELSAENVSTKRKHPMSPLTSSAGDEQTVTRIERKKKGQRLVFDSKCPGQISVTDTSKKKFPAYVNILPSLPTHNLLLYQWFHIVMYCLPLYLQ